MVFSLESHRYVWLLEKQVLAGSLSGSKKCLTPVRALHNILGGVLDPVCVHLLIFLIYPYRLWNLGLNSILLKRKYQEPVGCSVFWIKYGGTKFPLPEQSLCVQKFYAYWSDMHTGLEQNAAYLILRGLKTLSIRVRQQNATALKLARTLEAHPKVDFAFQPLKHECASCFCISYFLHSR
jgi:hypothetical protein